MQMNVCSQIANFDLFVYDLRKTQETNVCLDFLFEILSIFNSNFNSENRYPDVLVVFLFLHRLINAWISRRNRFEFILRNHSVIPQANSGAAVTIRSLRRADNTKNKKKFPDKLMVTGTQGTFWIWRKTTFPYDWRWAVSCDLTICDREQCWQTFGGTVSYIFSI